MGDFDTRMRQSWENTFPDKNKERVPIFYGFLVGGVVSFVGYTLSPNASGWLHALIFFMTVVIAASFFKKQPRLAGYLLLFLIIGVVLWYKSLGG